MINERTKLVSMAHVSNVLGTVNDVKHVTTIAHKYGIPVLVDGAQSTPHFHVDVKELDCDFLPSVDTRCMALLVSVCSMVKKNGWKDFHPIKVAAK